MWPLYITYLYTTLGAKNTIPSEAKEQVKEEQVKEKQVKEEQVKEEQVKEVKNANKIKPTILVHGGAGDIVDYRVDQKLDGCKRAAQAGYKVLQNGGSSVDAVEAAINVLEDDPAFNAGYGAVLNKEGNVEVDAGIMRGEDLSLGGVAVAKDILHPISLAKLVMQKSPHVLLAGEGANKFAEENKFPIAEPGSLVTEGAKRALEQFKEFGGGLETVANEHIKGLDTVGAVAIDANGKLAAGTSTGGITGKLPGRVGDASQAGKGVYADDRAGAVSITGHGESVCKICLSHKIIMGIRNGKSTCDATNSALQEMLDRLGQTAGAIVLNNKGDVGINFTAQRMAWAYKCDCEMHYGIDHGQHKVEKDQ